MVTKKTFFYLAALTLLSLPGINCTKQPSSCLKFGYEYLYNKPGVSYFPGSDSILLGSEIVVEGSVAKTFWDQQYNYQVSLSANDIRGPLSVSKAVTSPFLSFAGAINDVELTAVTGSLIKDSVLYSSSQLESIRTTYWDGNSVDSFKLKIKIKPRYRGVYFISIRDQSNRDMDCALYKYQPTVKNIDQHFYLMTPITNGEISAVAQNYLYCFKVY